MMNKSKIYNSELSVTLSKYSTIKECFTNSVKTMLFNEWDGEAYYTEGYSIPDFGVPGLLLPIEHGWIEIDYDDHTHIVDVTLPLTSTKEQQLNTKYFTGDRYTRSKLVPLIESVFPLYESNLLSEEFRKARLEAYRYCFGNSVDKLLTKIIEDL
jgi:hypothetical protein